MHLPKWWIWIQAEEILTNYRKNQKDVLENSTVRLFLKKFSSFSQDLYENFKYTHMDSLKLLPMGRVFHFQDMTMQPIKRNGRIYDYVMREITEKEYFDEIIFSRQLVKHHFPPLYEDALFSPRVLYQRYLEKAVNKEGSSISSSSEVRPYTK